MNLLEALSTIADPRRRQGLRTDLEQIFYMSIIGYLSGHKGYREVAKFCKKEEKVFIKALSLRHGVPSHVTFWTVLTEIADSDLIKAFNLWTQTYVSLKTEDWVSADGKTLGSTVVNANNKNQDFQAVVSLFCHQSGLVLSLKDYRNKTKETGEGSIARFLIEQLNGMGLIFTVDALHTQKKRLT